MRVALESVGVFREPRITARISGVWSNWTRLWILVLRRQRSLGTHHSPSHGTNQRVNRSRDLTHPRKVSSSTASAGLRSLGPTVITWRFHPCSCVAVRQSSVLHERHTTPYPWKRVGPTREARLHDEESFFSRIACPMSVIIIANTITFG